MNALLYYLLQVVGASGLLYLYYHIALRNKKFHQYNRFYLLAAMLLSILIPFLNIPVYFTPNDTHTSIVLRTLTVISSPAVDENPVFITAAAAPVHSFSITQLLYFIYSLFASFVLAKIIASVWKIKKITRRYPVEKIDTIKFINTRESGTPFSFFHSLFWHQDIELDSAKGERIFRHEMFHIRERHSIDIMLTELLTAIFWINPFFHLMKKELRAIHEFLADRFAVEETDKWDYAELLLMQALQTKHSLVNPFFYNQIKRRIAMITNPKKTSHQYLRKMLVLPLAAIVVTLFAFKYRNAAIDPVIPLSAPITVVIDAGHGGDDPGVKSPDATYDEATVSLSLAKKIQSLAAAYNIKVVLTREDAHYPGNATNKEDGLKKRVDITTTSKADMFISLHLNYAGGKEFQKQYSGIEAYVSGKREDEKGKVLASSILQELSGIYKTNDTWKSREHNGVWVLDKNNCPSVLFEIGYINNHDDLAFVTNESNQEKIAKSILQGIVNYKKNSSLASTSTITDTLPRIILTGNIFINAPDKFMLQADSIVFVNEPKSSKDFDVPHSLVVLEGKMQSPDFIRKNTIIKGDITVYPRNDKEAIKLYGEKAAVGLIIVKNATIINVPSSEYYKEVFEKEEKQAHDENSIFEKVEIEASFVGGQTAWQTYLKNNLDQSIPVKNHAPAGQYSVDVQFIVATNGSISDVRAITNYGYGMEEEVIRIIKNGPRWQPAMQNGRVVTAYRKQRITFSVGNGSAKDASAIKLGEVVYVSYLDKSSSVPTANAIPEISLVEPGSSRWKRYFERNIDLAPAPAEKLIAGSYNLYIRFAVDSKGNVSEPVVLNYAGSGMAAACQAVINHIHKVIPAAETVANEKTWYFQPVSFHIIDPSPTANTIPKISVIELKKANTNTLLKLKDDVYIKSFTFTTDLPNGDIAAVENNGNQISAGMLKLVNGIYAGNLITIDNIVLLENGKEKKVPSLIYEVVN